MKPYNEENVREFLRSILEDEFDDKSQNESSYGGRVSGHSVLLNLIGNALNVVSKSNDSNNKSLRVLNLGAGGTSLVDDFNELVDSVDGISKVDLFVLEPSESRRVRMDEDANFVSGWAENINIDDSFFDLIISWGVLCFVRSLPETMIELNRKLRSGGLLILDVVSYSTMPLPQTTNPDSFVRYASLFGFDLYSRIPFGFRWHSREGFLFKRSRRFKSENLRMPQSVGVYVTF